MPRARIAAFAFSLCACAPTFSVATHAQTPTATPSRRANTAPARSSSPDPIAEQRRATAIALLVSLADEAKTYRDERLRARIQARAADALWDTDREHARLLFRRAWEAADAADRETARRVAENIKRQMERGSGTFISEGNSPNLRAEVLRFAARRDPKLAEEFLLKLNDEKKAEATTARTGEANSSASAPFNPTEPPRHIAERLQLARDLLPTDTERALAFADPALERVTMDGISFLSELREKNAELADGRFMNLTRRALVDESSDAVTASLLSSYVLTPFLYIVVSRNGSMSGQIRPNIVPPNINPTLRALAFGIMARILLRPVPPKDEDRTFAGRGGTYLTIKRLLPAFELHAPDHAVALRAQLAALSPDAPDSYRNNTDRMLTRGLAGEDTTRDEAQENLDNSERTTDAAERDALRMNAAVAAAHKGEIRARDLADKIDDAELRGKVRSHVDFVLVQNLLRKKDSAGALQLIRRGELPRVQRAWALAEVVRLLQKVDPAQAAEVLDEADAEANRIEASDPDRARALTNIILLRFLADRGRGWEALTDLTKMINAISDYTGEDGEIAAVLQTKRGVWATSERTTGFNLASLFAELVKDDLQRSVEAARSFTGEAPRAVSTLAIARTVLNEKRNAAGAR